MRIVNFFSLIFVLLFMGFLFLLNGFNTNYLNNIIKEKIEQKFLGSQINFKDTRISLNIKSFSVKLQLNEPELYFKKRKINIKDIKVDLDLLSSLRKKYSIKSVYVELDTTKISSVSSLLEEADEKIFNLSKKILNGTIEGYVDLDFDEIHKSKFKGLIRDSTIQFYENFPFASSVKAEFEYENSVLSIAIDSGKVADLDIKQSKIIINASNINEISVSSKIFVNGKIDYLTKLKEFKELTNNIIPKEVDSLKGDLNIDILLDAIISKDFSIQKLVSNSQIKTINGSFEYYLDRKSKNKLIVTKLNSISTFVGKNINTKGSFLLNDKSINFDFSKNIDSANFISNFSGSLDTADLNQLIKSKFINGPVGFKININNSKGFNVFEGNLDLEKSNIFLQDINYKKTNNEKANLKFLLDTKKEGLINISKLIYTSKDSEINFDNLILNSNYEIENFNNLKVKTPKNFFSVNKNKNLVSINGDQIDLTEFVKSLTKIKSEEDVISKKFSADINARIKKVYLDIDTLNEFVLSAKMQKAEYEFLNAFGSFSNTETASIQISKNKKNNLETKLVSDKSKPFLLGLNFAKGFTNGKLNFVSEKIANKHSLTKVTLSKFYVKEMPILANLLSLTSFTGIIDTLSGKGVYFEKSYLEFSTIDEVLTIKDAYGTGDSLGFTLEGSIQKDGFVSIEGNLVPAYLVNNIIKQIPLLGKIITGKEGDGVFGASFKIKGQPEALKTVVNPIRTLTPRFVQRFLDLFKSGSK